MGAWRDRYRAVNDEVACGKRHWTRRAAIQVSLSRYRSTQAANCSTVATFADVRQLKEMLIEDEATIARNVVKQLMIYATGAPIGFSDRQEIEAILARTRAGNYGVRSIVHEIVQSKLFQYK